MQSDARPILSALAVLLMVSVAMTQGGDTRPFRMGFTPWPYDFTSEAVDATYQVIGNHADLICHHIDDGIPWVEALEGARFPDHVEREIAGRIAATPPGHAVYLAVTPLNLDRKSLGGYWFTESNGPLPGSWEGLTFNSPEVMKAYTNYCLEMVDRFQPDYMAYGIEVDAALTKDHPSFGAFQELCEHVYGKIKEQHPDLPLFLTMTVGGFGPSLEQQLEADLALMPYSDYVAVSTYPYWMPSNGRMDGDPSTLDPTWLAQKAAIAPHKPFAVAETGWPAERLKLSQYDVDISASEQWQADYVELLCQTVEGMDGRFIVWFTARDYDQAWERLQGMGFDEFFATWRDTGLFGGGGNQRSALGVWDEWLGRKYRAP